MARQKRTVAHQLVASHLVDGTPEPGEEIALRIDQTLTQDATGTLVMLAVEAMGLDRARTEVSAQYVDHNLLQEDFRNADDHLFLLSACQRFGVWYSRPGNGVSHPVHQQHFGRPGATLLGSDSHTCAAGAIGMLAIGAGGLDVAMAMAGEPFPLRMPEIWGVELRGRLPDWVSAKDVILELLRRHGVTGGLGRIVEYHGPGLAELSVMDRHVIANMGAELGATTTVFPSDEVTRDYLRRHGRGYDWTALQADPGADYDVHDTIDLSRLEPLVALPSSPGNVAPVREVAGREIYQAYIGSSANPGYRDFAIAALMVEGRHVANHVSFDVNPTSRELLETLTRDGLLLRLLHAGARLHQAGCNGCIGMGQAPASGRISLRTVPRNFPGRSGTREDSVYLCSPETATASALTGVITDPRELGLSYVRVSEPSDPIVNREALVAPLPVEQARKVTLTRGPNIRPLPELDPLPDRLELPILLRVEDDVSTDEILPAGARVLPFRSNIERIADFCFEMIDLGYSARARETRGGHAIVAGENYGQGSSREHAALAPRHLGLRAVVAASYARIHARNLANYGVLPLLVDRPADHQALQRGAVLVLDGLRAALSEGQRELRATVGDRPIVLRHELTRRQAQEVLAGGLTNAMRQRLSDRAREKSR
jgi:aconitate hydratase